MGSSVCGQGTCTYMTGTWVHCESSAEGWGRGWGTGNIIAALDRMESPATAGIVQPILVMGQMAGALGVPPWPWLRQREEIHLSLC